MARRTPHGTEGVIYQERRPILEKSSYQLDIKADPLPFKTPPPFGRVSQTSAPARTVAAMSDLRYVSTQALLHLKVQLGCCSYLSAVYEETGASHGVMDDLR